VLVDACLVRAVSIDGRCAGTRALCVEKGYAVTDVLSQVCKYAVRIGFPPHIYAEVLAKLSDIEYRLAFGTNEKMQLASLCGAFLVARTRLSLEAAKGAS
jgi:DNA polymerase III delta prime subunit